MNKNKFTPIVYLWHRDMFFSVPDYLEPWQVSAKDVYLQFYSMYNNKPRLPW